MELSDVLTTFLGSGLGIGAAFLVNHFADNISDRKRIELAKENIEKELNIIRYQLLYPTGSDELTDEYITFETPIWNSLISTGDILTIRQSERFYNAALSSYRMIALMQNDDKNATDYNSAKKRIERVNYRRYVRDHLKTNLETINNALESEKKKWLEKLIGLFRRKEAKPSKEEIALKREEKERTEKLKEMFCSCAKGKIPNENIKESFGERKIGNKGLFFCTTCLDTFAEDNAIDATYGIGFGEYDCEIYLSLSIKESEIGDKSKAILDKLDALDEVIKGDILKTYYEKTGADIKNYNYSRFALASNVCNDKFDRKTIDENTISKMLDTLYEFEKVWLINGN